jgi:transglutaminase-like putative cysteine protease
MNSLSGARSPWIATPFVAIATYLGLYGLSTMIEMGPWRLRMISILAIVTVAIAVTRIVSRSRFLPTAVGAIVSLLVCVPAFARDENGAVMFLPTPSALAALGTAVQDAVRYASTTVAPAEVTLEFLALLTLGMLALFLATEHLAVSWRFAASAGLLLLLPWLPAVILQHRVPGVVLLVAIGCWLFVLGLTKRISVTDRSAAPVPALMATVAALALVVVAAPTALGGNGWGMIPRIAAPQELEAATRLNLALDLRTSLTTGADSPILYYVTSGERPDVLRLYALTEFDGAAWQREDPEASNRPASSGVLWPVAVDGWENRETDRLNIQVLSLAETNLPVPAVPRAVDVDNSWTYVSGLDEIVTEGNGTQNLQYSTVADFGYFDAAEMQAMQPTAEDDAAAGVGAAYTNIAPAIDANAITALAQEITVDATSRYDQALAIQTYLRNQQEFTYDTSVPPQGADTVSTFLEEKRGYCVQFATTMVVMMRSLGVPARMAVGFLPGTRRDDGAYEVRGGDAHAWPEVFFPEVGWVRFEPTPSAQTGATPIYANPESDEIPVPQSVLDAAQNGQPAPVPSGAPEQGQGRPEESDANGSASDIAWPILIAAVTVALAMLAAGLWLMLRRRRALAALGEGPDAAWAWLYSQLPEELAWPLSATPHEAAEHVTTSLERLGSPLPSRAADALAAIVNAVSDHRYAPQGTSATEAQLRELAAVVIAAALEALEAATGRPARGGARNALRA